MTGPPHDPRRPLVMGIVNVTPDSFSDGGRWADPDAAVAHGLQMLAEGADLVDVGGESTRPGADPAPVAEELTRVLPVIGALVAEGVRGLGGHDARRGRQRPPSRPGRGSSTTCPAGWPTPALLEVVADVRRHVSSPCTGARTATGCRSTRRTTARAGWSRRCAASWPTGSRRCSPRASPADRIVLDPGLGFAKRPDHNWAAAARGWTGSPALGHPLLVGRVPQVVPGDAAGRRQDGAPRPTEERELRPRGPGRVCSHPSGAVGAARARRPRHQATRWRWRDRQKRGLMTDRLTDHRDRVLRAPRRPRASSAATDRSSGST